MSKRIPALFVSVAMACPSLGDDAADKELKRLDGKWTVVRMEFQGQSMEKLGPG